MSDFISLLPACCGIGDLITTRQKLKLMLSNASQGLWALVTSGKSDVTDTNPLRYTWVECFLRMVLYEPEILNDFVTRGDHRGPIASFRGANSAIENAWNTLYTPPFITWIKGQQEIYGPISENAEIHLGKRFDLFSLFQNL